MVYTSRITCVCISYVARKQFVVSIMSMSFFRILGIRYLPNLRLESHALAFRIVGSVKTGKSPRVASVPKGKFIFGVLHTVTTYSLNLLTQLVSTPGSISLPDPSRHTLQQQLRADDIAIPCQPLPFRPLLH